MGGLRATLGGWGAGMCKYPYLIHLVIQVLEPRVVLCCWGCVALGRRGIDAKCGAAWVGVLECARWIAVLRCSACRKKSALCCAPCVAAPSALVSRFVRCDPLFRFHFGSIGEYGQCKARSNRIAHVGALARIGWCTQIAIVRSDDALRLVQELM